MVVLLSVLHPHGGTLFVWPSLWGQGFGVSFIGADVIGIGVSTHWCHGGQPDCMPGHPGLGSLVRSWFGQCLLVCFIR